MRDIGLHITVEADEILPSSLISVIDDIESALYHSDRMDIEQLFAELEISSDFPKDELAVLRDASLERLRKHRNERVVIRALRPSSFEIYATLIAIALFVTKDTIWQSGKEAWKGSLWDKVFQVYFGRIFESKPLNIYHFLKSAPRLLKNAAIIRDGFEIRVVISARRIKRRRNVKTLSEIDDTDRSLRDRPLRD